MLDFSLENDMVNIYSFSFFLFPSTEFDIIFGTDILRNQDAEISFKDSTIALSGHFYELHITPAPIHHLDRTLMEKTIIFTFQNINQRIKIAPLL